ncbi:MAG: protein-L-isoaspartate(D-aspartate) O-methyltransferase [bacterium]
MNDEELTRRRGLMVERQLKRRGIQNEEVLRAFMNVPRHRFVGPALRHSAYADHPLPIGEGQTISQPYMVALMTQCLELKSGDRVLEIGTGSGYQTAILAAITAHVFTIERIPSLTKNAEAILKELGYNNVRFLVGDGTKGWPEEAPFDGILVTAGAPRLPEPLIDQLTEGGRLVIPVGRYWSQDLMVIRKIDGGVEEKFVCGCVFVPLVGEFGWKDRD